MNNEILHENASDVEQVQKQKMENSKQDIEKMPVFPM